MLKTTISSQVLIPNKILIANEVDGIEDSNKLIKKYGKLLKTGKLAKSWKKLSKSGNLFKFDVKKNEPSFLTLDAWIVFNCLWLAFIKALILWHFDPECYIWNEIDISSYAIDSVLS